MAKSFTAWFPVCCTLQLALPWSGFVTLRGEILWHSASCSIKWSWLLQEGSCHILSCLSSPIRHSLFSAPSYWPSNRTSHCCETAFLLLVTAVCTLPSGLLVVLTHTRDKPFLLLLTARLWGLCLMTQWTHGRLFGFLTGVIMGTCTAALREGENKQVTPNLPTAVSHLAQR